MDEQYNEITLGQIFGVIGKSLKRGLIYILVTAIIVFGVLFTIKSLTDTNIYVTTLTFSESDETTLNDLNSTKATVLNKALEKLGKDTTDSSKLVDNLTITAIEPTKTDDSETTNYLATTFDISLKGSSKLSYSPYDYKTLLDNVANEYVNSFSDRKLQQITLNYSETVFDSEEYIQQVYELSQLVSEKESALSSYLTEFEELSDYESSITNITIADTISVLKSYNTALTILKSNIVNNKIEKTSGALKTYLESQKQIADSNADVYGSQYDATKVAIENYQKIVVEITKNDNGNNTYNLNDKGYLELCEKLDEYAKLKAEAKKESSSIQANIDTITASAAAATTTPSSELTEQIKNDIKNIYNSLKKDISNYNTLAKEYNEFQSKTSTASQVSYAKTTTSGIISTSVILIVLVVAVLIAYIVAFSQTYSKLKKTGYFENNN